MAAEESLLARLERALVESMKARDAGRTSTLRMVKAALTNKQIDKRAALDEGDVLQVLGTLAKQRRESIEQFRAGGREDLAQKEETELRILREYLPEELGEAELRDLVANAVTQSGASGPKDMGKVMAALMPLIKGRADGKLVNQLVREHLAQGVPG